VREDAMSKGRVILAALVLAAMAGAVTTFAQRGGMQRRESSTSSYTGNVRYDGRFVFVRMSYAFSGRQQAPWSHDYSAGEYSLLKIIEAITNMRVHINESSIMSFSDPELFKFPVAYLIEPGYWYMSETDVTALRSYLLKGGFLVVDDFPQWAWGQFDVQMSRVFPEGKWIKLDSTHPIFHSFYELDDISHIPTAYTLGSGPVFYAMFEDNDPKKRMYAIVNYMNDISEFWEFSEKGTYLIQDTNEAFKFGINEFIYGITH
jgi:hypothetical protein